MFADISILGSFLGSFLIVILILVGIFLLTREIFLWYWKINEIVSLLKQIRIELSIITGSNKSNDEAEIICVHCGKESKINKNLFRSGEFICPKCNKLNTYKPLQEEKYYNINCQYCNINIEIDEIEYQNGKFNCPACNKENIISQN
ncbi:MAG TPA: hypothetical protein PK447_06735 [Ignavibacteria bacterium]|nr:hypothetical protein [Ignavibacteria bacterium]